MNFPEYRQQGLPITSSQIESTVKLIKHRVNETGSCPFYESKDRRTYQQGARLGAQARIWKLSAAMYILPCSCSLQEVPVRHVQ